MWSFKVLEASSACTQEGITAILDSLAIYIWDNLTTTLWLRPLSSADSLQSAPENDLWKAATNETCKDVIEKKDELTVKEKLIKEQGKRGKWKESWKAKRYFERVIEDFGKLIIGWRVVVKNTGSGIRVNNKTRVYGRNTPVRPHRKHVSAKKILVRARRLGINILQTTKASQEILLSSLPETKQNLPFFAKHFRNLNDYPLK